MSNSPVDRPSKPMTLEDAFEAGWVIACDWARRDDLVADIGSPAYLEDRNLALGPKCDRGTPETGALQEFVKDLSRQHCSHGGDKNAPAWPCIPCAARTVLGDEEVERLSGTSEHPSTAALRKIAQLPAEPGYDLSNARIMRRIAEEALSAANGGAS
jgi:hypothetical protein